MSMPTCIPPQPKTTSLAVVVKKKKLNTPVSSRNVVHQPRRGA